MHLIEAIILGIVQGLTEFLPVSSSGHIELASALLGTDSKENLLFSIIVHAATALSTVVVFRKDIFHLIKGLAKFRNNEETQFVLKILLSAIPVAFTGLLFEEHIEQLFGGNLIVVGFGLLITAFLLLLTYYVKKEGSNVSTKQALIIGLAQAVAIIPGISRSGATIATALLIGVDRQKAARFSFLMVLIPILGAAFLKLLDYLENPALAQGISGTSLAAGFISAFLAGLLACSWMIGIVKRGKLTYFALYCFIVGLLAIGNYYLLS
jgi:undecaprenyl-diphosphatase